MAHVSPRLIEAASLDGTVVLQRLGTPPGGLSEDEAMRRLDALGSSLLVGQDRWPRIRTLLRAIVNPLVLLLLMLAITSFIGGADGL